MNVLRNIVNTVTFLAVAYLPLPLSARLGLGLLVAAVAISNYVAGRQS